MEKNKVLRRTTVASTGPGTQAYYYGRIAAPRQEPRIRSLVTDLISPCSQQSLIASYLCDVRGISCVRLDFQIGFTGLGLVWPSMRAYTVDGWCSARLVVPVLSSLVNRRSRFAAVEARSYGHVYL